MIDILWYAAPVFLDFVSAFLQPMLVKLMLLLGISSHGSAAEIVGIHSCFASPVDLFPLHCQQAVTAIIQPCCNLSSTDCMPVLV